MLVSTFGKSSKPYLTLHNNRPDGIDFFGRTYSTNTNSSKLPIPKEIRKEIQNNIINNSKSPDNLLKTAAGLSFSERPTDKLKAGAKNATISIERIRSDILTKDDPNEYPKMHGTTYGFFRE